MNKKCNIFKLSLEEKFLLDFIVDLERDGDPIDNIMISANTLINYIL